MTGSAWSPDYFYLEGEKAYCTTILTWKMGLHQAHQPCGPCPSLLNDLTCSWMISLFCFFQLMIFIIRCASQTSGIVLNSGEGFKANQTIAVGQFNLATRMSKAPVKNKGPTSHLLGWCRIECMFSFYPGKLTITTRKKGQKHRWVYYFYLPRATSIIVYLIRHTWSSQFPK